MRKDKMVIIIIVGIVAAVLSGTMFMQFRAVEWTEETQIEGMREAELRTTIEEYKEKYEELETKLLDNNKKIDEYNQKLESNQESAELVEKELEQTNLLVGKTKVKGEGVIVTLKDVDENRITPDILVELINELRYAGAEAISINNKRIINMTDIAEVTAGYLVINSGDQSRITSPYEVKAIGKEEYLASNLSLKNVGFIDKYNSSGYDIQLTKDNNITIEPYEGNINIKYMEEAE